MSTSPEHADNVIQLAHSANPAADNEEARELAEFLELIRVVRENAEPDCAVEALSIEHFKGASNVKPSRQ